MAFVRFWRRFPDGDRKHLPLLYAATMDVPGNSYLGPHGLRELRGWPTGGSRLCIPGAGWFGTF